MYGQWNVPALAHGQPLRELAGRVAVVTTGVTGALAVLSFLWLPPAASTAVMVPVFGVVWLLWACMIAISRMDGRWWNPVPPIRGWRAPAALAWVVVGGAMLYVTDTRLDDASDDRRGVVVTSTERRVESDSSEEEDRAFTRTFATGMCVASGLAAFVITSPPKGATGESTA
jgi:hypothetical protein